VLGLREMLLAGVDEGRPHVQADRLDPLALRRWESLEVGRQALLLAFLTDVLDRCRLQIAHQRHVAMPLGNGLLVHARIPGQLGTLGRSATDHRPLHQRPSFIPGDAQDAGGALDVGRKQHLDRQYLEKMREAAARICPGHTNLAYPMFGARHSRRAGMQEGQELAAVQVPPHPLGQMVIHGKCLPALRARKSRSRRVARHLNMRLRHVQFHPLDRPRIAQPQQLPVQLVAVHRAAPLKALRDSVPSTHTKP
jgi:hypothetical protein